MSPGGRGSRRPGGRTLLRLAALVVFSAIVWGIGLVRFAAMIPDAVVDTTTTTDAIVVLTGGSGRLGVGLELLSANRARSLFVSGVYRGVEVTKLLELSQRTPQELECCVEIGHSADNTAGNAAETAAWVVAQGYRSLRLVTSGYHLPRSLLEFRHAMPDVTLIPHPVFSESVKQERWWAWPGTANLIVGEFNKYLLAWLTHKVEGVGIGKSSR